MKPSDADEVWKDIVGYEGLYQVSNLGRVKSLERDVLFPRNGKIFTRRAYTRILKFRLCRGEYPYVILSKDATRATKKIHRLVAEAFLPNLEGKEQVDHINGDSCDNRLENLRWATAKENCNNPITLQRRRAYIPTEEHRRKVSKANSKKSSERGNRANIRKPDRSLSDFRAGPRNSLRELQQRETLWRLSLEACK